MTTLHDVFCFLARYSIYIIGGHLVVEGMLASIPEEKNTMAVPNSWYAQTRNDFSNEKSNWSVAIVDLTAANVVAQQALIATLVAAVDAIVLTSAIKTELVFDRQGFGGGTPPTDPLAQRENKWLVRYVGDATFKVFTTEIPGADLTMLSTDPQTDFADLTGTEMAAFVAAFEAVVRSPEDPTETVTVRNIQFVGRRL